MPASANQGNIGIMVRTVEEEDEGIGFDNDDNVQVPAPSQTGAFCQANDGDTEGRNDGVSTRGGRNDAENAAAGNSASILSSIGGIIRKIAVQGAEPTLASSAVGITVKLDRKVAEQGIEDGTSVGIKRQVAETTLASSAVGITVKLDPKAAEQGTEDGTGVGIKRQVAEPTINRQIAVQVAEPTLASSAVGITVKSNRESTKQGAEDGIGVGIKRQILEPTLASSAVGIRVAKSTIDHQIAVQGAEPMSASSAVGVRAMEPTEPTVATSATNSGNTNSRFGTIKAKLADAVQQIGRKSRKIAAVHQIGRNSSIDAVFRRADRKTTVQDHEETKNYAPVVPGVRIGTVVHSSVQVPVACTVPPPVVTEVPSSVPGAVPVVPVVPSSVPGVVRTGTLSINPG